MRAHPAGVDFVGAADKRPLTAIGAAIIGYLVFDGFVINQMGELSWNGRDDLARLLTLIAAVIFGRLSGDCYRLYRLFARARVERRTSTASNQSIKENEHHA